MGDGRDATDIVYRHFVTTETYDAVIAVGVFGTSHVRDDALPEILRITKKGKKILRITKKG